MIQIGEVVILDTQVLKEKNSRIIECEVIGKYQDRSNHSVLIILTTHAHLNVNTVITKNYIKQYNLNSKYLKHYCRNVWETEVSLKVKNQPGVSCKKCKDYNSYAVSNFADGSFVCYSCRKG